MTQLFIKALFKRYADYKKQGKDCIFVLHANIKQELSFKTSTEKICGFLMKLKQEASVQAQDEIEGENKESANSFEHFDT